MRVHLKSFDSKLALFIYKNIQENGISINATCVKYDIALIACQTIH